MEATYHNMPQGSEAWVSVRLAKVTGSNFKIAMGKGKGRSDLMDALVEEYFTQVQRKCVRTACMEHGTEMEPFAIAEYERRNRCTVERVGFIEISEHIGASPDGLVGDDGGIECKCPLPKTHLKYCRANKPVTAYLPQIDGCMWATGRKWWDMVSYCPECKLKPYWSIRIPRDETRIAEIDVKINIFANELKQIITDITGPTF